VFLYSGEKKGSRKLTRKPIGLAYHDETAHVRSKRNNQLYIGAAFPSLNNSISFSLGVKFKSKHKTLLLLDFFTTGTTCLWSELGGLKGSASWFWSFKAALCLLIWPPKACPIANSSPQIEHSCVLGFAGDWDSKLPSPPINLGFLWLARWPPKAWNDGNFLLHVLHSKTRLGELLLMAWSKEGKEYDSLPLDRNTRQFAMVMLSISLAYKLLFMVTQI
jgi:hypothetical protein